MNVTRHLSRTFNKSDCQPALHISNRCWRAVVLLLLVCLSGDGAPLTKTKPPRNLTLQCSHNICVVLFCVLKSLLRWSTGGAKYTFIIGQFHPCILCASRKEMSVLKAFAKHFILIFSKNLNQIIHINLLVCLLTPSSLTSNLLTSN